jgi:hypothetical protein
MTEKKISELTERTTPVAADLLVLVDSDAIPIETKRVTWLNLSKGMTLDNCIAKGTWTASGTWTIPAVTLGGTLTAGSQIISARYVVSPDDISLELGANGSGSVLLQTDNAAGAGLNRVTLGGGTDLVSLGIVNTWLTFNTSIDSDAIADQVSIGGYDISAGHRALAISSEEVIVAETDETKFSHKLPVRINGATYNIMLCAT